MKLVKASNPFKLVLVTESREELCALAKTLFEGMNPALFTDRNHPVVVSVRGAYGSGKTIFPDIMKEICIPDAICTSRALYKTDKLDESFSGTYLGKPLDFTFINSSYVNRFFYSHPAIQETSYKDDGRGIVFIGLRQNGGITFIHNDDDAVLESSIDIWIEDGFNTVEGTREESRLKKSSLKDLFKNQSKEKTWKRYIELSVYDHRLFGDENFMKKLGSCKGIMSLTRTHQTHPKEPTPRKLTPTQKARQLKAMEEIFKF